MATKTIEKVLNNKQNPENFDVSYHIYEGVGLPVINADENSEMYNLETKENVPIEEIFLGKEFPIENIVIAHRAFKSTEIDTLKIAEGVTEIPIGCFHKAKITTLTLPSTIKTVGFAGFKNAEIDTLKIPEGVTEIPIGCFHEAKIQTLILPSTLETIGDRAFKDAKINTLEIAKGIREISTFSFFSATIKTLKLPSSLETISNSAFKDARIDTLAIPEGVTEIPTTCFAGTKIKALKLSSKLSSIGDRAFYDADIDSLYIKNVSSIGEDAFKGFQGTIFTDNSESKAEFEKAGLDPKQVVDLEIKKECFGALKEKTMTEIHKLETAFGRRILPENFYKFENNIYFPGSNESLAYKEMFSGWKLIEVTRFKVKIADDPNVLSASKNIVGNSLFKQDGSNHRKHTNPDSPQPKKS